MTSLPAHPDVRPALERLRAAGVRLATLTNSTAEVAEAQLEFAGIRDLFEASLSADTVGRLKPAPQPYRLRGGAARRADRAECCSSPPTPGTSRARWRPAHRPRSWRGRAWCPTRAGASRTWSSRDLRELAERLSVGDRRRRGSAAGRGGSAATLRRRRAVTAWRGGRGTAVHAILVWATILPEGHSVTSGQDCAHDPAWVSSDDTSTARWRDWSFTASPPTPPPSGPLPAQASNKEAAPSPPPAGSGV